MPRVVDLPEPVGPVTRIIPFDLHPSYPLIPEAAQGNRSLVPGVGICLKTAATEPFCIKTVGSESRQVPLPQMKNRVLGFFPIWTSVVQLKFDKPNAWYHLV
jgi:hypothetical protein